MSLARRTLCRTALMLVCVVPCCVAGQTVNTSLQRAVERGMANARGTAVVLDVHSGQIIAAYRPEVAARRVVRPGSTIKPFTLLALLQAGKVDDHTALLCKRSLYIAGHKLDCSHPETGQPLDPASALAYSCNSYFTAVALRLRPAELRDSYLSDGFTSMTLLAPNEGSGAVEMAQSPQKLQLQSIGEWGIRVTPMQMARAYRTLALMQPGHQHNLNPLFTGLEDSVQYGMANAAKPAGSMKVAGKTGTAPADEGQWTHGWFAGYAPAQNPQIVLVVFLERGHGGSDAAGIARGIFTAFSDLQRSATGTARVGASR